MLLRGCAHALALMYRTDSRVRVIGWIYGATRLVPAVVPRYGHPMHTGTAQQRSPGLSGVTGSLTVVGSITGRGGGVRTTAR
eukprot:COSAG01_NODE_4955_length_4591_cov_6.138468_8_plen_82_part_00